MKVLHLVSSIGYFGAENMLIALAREQMARGNEVCVGVFNNLRNPHLETARKAGQYGIPSAIFPVKARFDLSAIRELKAFVRDRRVDIVHSHGYKSNFYAYASTFMLDVKRVTTCHTWCNSSAALAVYNLLDKMLIRGFHRVVAVSQVLAKEIVESGVPRGKVSFIRNGVNAELFLSRSSRGAGARLAVRREFGIGDTEQVIGTIGRLDEEKGHTYLLQSAPAILAAFPGTRLMFIGDGPLRESLEQEAKARGIADAVIFTGVRDDIPSLFEAMDVFVLPSLKEGMPMVLFEALLCRKPVVATRVGSISEVVVDRETGFLIRPKDPGELQESLLMMLRDRKAAQTLAEKGYTKVLTEFSSSKMADDYLALYSSLIN